MTPRAWTKGSMKSHTGAAMQKLSGLRAAMLRAAESGDGQALAETLRDIGAAITAEAEWVRKMQPVPDSLAISGRLRWMVAYVRVIRTAAETLTQAVEPPATSEKFEPFGVALLSMLAVLADYDRATRD